MVTTYRAFVDKWKDCTLCPLAQNRDRIVFARGTVPCDVLFVGEGPGADEDMTGEPFVGVAGQLLNNVISESVEVWEIPRIDGLGDKVRYALCNLVCCMPPRDDEGKQLPPAHDEVLACEPRLREFVEICDPKLIVCVGKLVANWLDTKAHHKLQLHRPYRWTTPFYYRLEREKEALGSTKVGIKGGQGRGSNGKQSMKIVWEDNPKLTPAIRVVEMYHTSWMLRQNEVNKEMFYRRAVVTIYDAIEKLIQDGLIR